MQRIPLAAAALTAAFLTQTASAQQGLLITEFAVTPTAAEFVEIHNPTTQTIDLTDVYITDATFQGGGTFYYQIVEGGGGGGGFGDWHARFPNGSSISGGAYLTISLAGSDGFFATYGFDPDFELFEDGGGPDAIPDMLEATPGSIGGQGGLTNGDEIVILYTWDGVSDLVTDLDYVGYGGNNEQVDKTGVVIDGPDGDLVGSAYAADTPIGSQADAPSPSSGNSAQRRFLGEGTETNSGGNGENGHDETSENVDFTWISDVPTPGGRTVGSLSLFIGPGQSGVPNTLGVEGAGANNFVFLFISLDLGFAGVPRCPGLAFGIDILSPGAHVIGRPANAAGLLTLNGTPPATSLDVYVQAVVGPPGVDCEASNVAVIEGI